jgi:hypothetical protein
VCEGNAGDAGFQRPVNRWSNRWSNTWHMRAMSASRWIMPCRKKEGCKSVYLTSVFDQCWSSQYWSNTVGLALDHALPASGRGVAVEQGLI